MVSNVCLKFLLLKVEVKEVNTISQRISEQKKSIAGVIVEDCLTVLLNLLNNNASNQSYFRESSFIRRLVQFFELNSLGDQRWLPQKKKNVQLFLQVNIPTLIVKKKNRRYVY